MSNLSQPDTWDSLVKVISPIMSFLIVCFTLWYVIETKMLRERADEQIQLLKKQLKLSSRPTFYIEIEQGKKYKDIFSKTSEDKKISINGDEKVLFSNIDLNREWEYFLLIRSTSDLPARNLFAYVYDGNKKCYYKPFANLESIDRQYITLQAVYPDYVSIDELSEDICEFYLGYSKFEQGQPGWSKFKSFESKFKEMINSSSQKSRSRSLLFTFFLDYEGNLLLYKKIFWQSATRSGFSYESPQVIEINQAVGVE